MYRTQFLLNNILHSQNCVAIGEELVRAQGVGRHEDRQETRRDAAVAPTLSPREKPFLKVTQGGLLNLCLEIFFQKHSHLGVKIFFFSSLKVI